MFTDNRRQFETYVQVRLLRRDCVLPNPLLWRRCVAACGGLVAGSWKCASVSCFSPLASTSYDERHVGPCSTAQNHQCVLYASGERN
jgi:hypothetical protein